MTRKLKSETSSQKIDVSADIIFGSLTLQSDFVILDLKYLFGMSLCSMLISLSNVSNLLQNRQFFVTIATVKVKLIPDVYTWAIVLIN